MQIFLGGRQGLVAAGESRRLRTQVPGLVALATGTPSGRAQGAVSSKCGAPAGLGGCGWRVLGEEVVGIE